MDMEQHVRRKLTSIVNRLEGGHRIGTHADTLFYTVYAYGHETALVLTALGLSHPLVRFLSSEAAGSEHPAASSSVLFESLTQYPVWLLAVSCLLIVFWIFTRASVNHRKLGDKVPLYRACSRELGKAESDLDAALSSSLPLAALSDLQLRVKDIVDNYYAADGWPWPISPPNSEEEIQQRIDSLCVQYRNNWDALPAGVQQQEPGRST